MYELNFSHGDFEESMVHASKTFVKQENIRQDIAILLDTKVQRSVRTVENGSIELIAGADLIVSMEDIVGNAEKISVTYEDLIHDVEVGSTILLDDGLIGLEVEKN
ncbi:pyruvate kinase [Bacillus sp. SL00103]